MVPNEDIQLLLHQYADVFKDPQTLPPPRSYDHAIPLMFDAVPSIPGLTIIHLSIKLK